MNDFLTAVGAVLPVFAIAAAGALIRRLGWLTAEADASLIKLTVNLLFPCFVFDRLVGNGAFEQAGNVVLPPLVGFAEVAVGVLVARIFAGLAGPLRPEARRTFVFTTAVANYGYLPLPLVASLWRAEPEVARQTTAVLLVHNVGVEIAMWTFGLVLLGGAPLREAWRRILSAPVIAIFASLALNFTVSRGQLPGPLLTATHLLAECAIPLGLLLVGATMADHAQGFVGGAGRRTMAAACALRLAIVPPVFLLLVWLLPGPLELRRVIAVQAAMPAAVFPIVMAKHYGGDPATALRVVLGTSLVSFATMPLWLRAGLGLVGG